MLESKSEEDVRTQKLKILAELTRLRQICCDSDLWSRILERANRIIICEDNEQIGWGIFWTLNKYYKISGRIDLRSSWKVPDISCLGINEIFRKSISYSTRTWEELDDLHRQSKIVAADHLLMKTRILLNDETITELTASVVKKAYERYCETKDLEAMQLSTIRLTNVAKHLRCKKGDAT